MLPSQKTLTLPLFAAVIAFIFTACNDSTTGVTDAPSQIESHTVENIGTGSYRAADTAYYNLRKNKLVEKADSTTDKWDIALSRTTIYINNGISGPGEGGAIVLDQSFDATEIAPSKGYNSDTKESMAIPTGSGNGWYNYNPSNHLITPIEDKTIVLKTADGEHYAKLKIISYNKDNPDLSSDEFKNNPEKYPSGYYTFEYVIQLNGTREFK
ncbi:HmuY family protein [Fodinibius saliphilus]|uniref:HmuY family protein n=1 Tax=Fodinibius saliphilus TaxID=1920650 RepID=UPI0011092C13|nr:HmuY family protein [Fodinibius saliphilus]